MLVVTKNKVFGSNHFLHVIGQQKQIHYIIAYVKSSLTFNIHHPGERNISNNVTNWSPVCQQSNVFILPSKYIMSWLGKWAPCVPNGSLGKGEQTEGEKNIPPAFVDMDTICRIRRGTTARVGLIRATTYRSIVDAFLLEEWNCDIIFIHWE